MKQRQVLSSEFLGTALLVMSVVGSGIMGERLAQGNPAIALLANTGATGAMLAVLISILEPVSGAHFNPAVTCVFAVQRKLNWVMTARYIGAQVAGGVAGAIVVNVSFGLPGIFLSKQVRSGPGILLGEVIAAFALILVVWAAVALRSKHIPLLVAATIMAGYWYTPSTSFANPAVTIARALSDTFAGIRPVDVPAFIAAQFIGTAAAAVLCRWMYSEVR